MLTACPDFPYSLKGMVEEGLTPNNVTCRDGYRANQKVISCSFDDIALDWAANMETVEANKTLAKVWKSTEVQLNEFFKMGVDIEKWHPAVTSRNICFNRKYSSSSLDNNVFVPIEDPLKVNCSVFVKDEACYLSPTTILEKVHLRISSCVSGGYPTVLAAGNELSWVIKPFRYCSYLYPCVKDLIVNAYHHYAVDTPMNPCNSDAQYSQSKCWEQCNLEAVTERFQCSPPYHHSNSSACTVDEYRHIKDFDVLPGDYNEECVKKCPQNCYKVFLTARTRQEQYVSQVIICPLFILLIASMSMLAINTCNLRIYIYIKIITFI